MDIDRHVGQRVKKKRRQVSLSHDQVAARIGCSVSQIMRYESGDTSLKPETLYNLAYMFGCKPGYFFEGIDV